jgi:hypothetical protein
MEAAAVDDMIRRLLEARGGRTPRNAQVTDAEIRRLCAAAKDVFLSQPNLLELEAPIKICGNPSPSSTTLPDSLVRPSVSFVSSEGNFVCAVFHLVVVAKSAVFSVVAVCPYSWHPMACRHALAALLVTVVGCVVCEVKNDLGCMAVCGAALLGFPWFFNYHSWEGLAIWEGLYAGVRSF